MIVILEGMDGGLAQGGGSGSGEELDPGYILKVEPSFSKLPPDPCQSCLLPVGSPPIYPITLLPGV